MSVEITTAEIKALRDESGVSVMECKRALEEAGGERERARAILRRRAGAAALKKSDRALGAGAVGAYVHNTNQVAALVHLSCETDFVAKNAEFIALAREIAMQVAALAPQCVSRAEVGAKECEKEQILLEQAFIKDPERTVGDVIEAATQKFGERIEVSAIRRLSVK